MTRVAKQTEWRGVETDLKLHQRAGKTEEAGGKWKVCGKTTEDDTVFRGGH